MSRYRKTMRQAIEEGLSNMQVAILKKEYEPFRGKTISAARAKQLMNILDKFKEDDLKKHQTSTFRKTLASASHGFFLIFEGSLVNFFLNHFLIHDS